MRKKVKLIQTTLNTARTNSNLNVTAVFIQIYRRQTKSKALTPTDRVRSSQQNEPIRTRGSTCRGCQGRENVRKRVGD